jgi:hypothetical protein
MILVANIEDYYHQWQLIPAGVFVLGWVLGGGWLFLRGLRKHSDAPARRLKFQRGLLASVTSGLAGMIVGLLLAALFYRISQRLYADWYITLGVVVGAVVGVVASYVTAYIVLGLTGKTTLKVATPPILGMVALAGALVAAFAPMTCSQTMAKLAREDCENNIKAIRYSLALHSRAGLMPKDLDALLQSGSLKDRNVRCPGNKNRAMGYFYMPRDAKKNQNPEQVLIVCDFAGNHPGGRNVIFADWRSDWLSDSEFENLLNLPVNQVFAKALRAAEPK